MRAIVTLFVFAAVLTAGRLRGTAFRCADSSDCGAASRHLRRGSTAIDSRQAGVTPVSARSENAHPVPG